MDDAHLSPEEREILRDFDAYSCGSHDVAREDVLARLQELTPEGWARIEAVMMKRSESLWRDSVRPSAKSSASHGLPRTYVGL
jgi:hypothetical protein